MNQDSLDFVSVTYWFTNLRVLSAKSLFFFPFKAPENWTVLYYLVLMSVQLPKSMRQRKGELYNFMGCVKGQAWKWLTSFLPITHGPCPILLHGVGARGGGCWEMKSPYGHIQRCLCHTLLPSWYTILSIHLPSECSSLIGQVFIVLICNRWP